MLELYALDGRALRQLGGFSLAPWQSPTVSNATLLDTVVIMTLNGAIFYAIADRLVRFGSLQSQSAAQLLFALSPFALLHPLGYLVRTNEYSLRADWLYAACATVIMVLSQRRQRRSFYYAGMLNLGIALFLASRMVRAARVGDRRHRRRARRAHRRILTRSHRAPTTLDRI